jgi:hypothetical protein
MGVDNAKDAKAQRTPRIELMVQTDKPEIQAPDTVFEKAVS